MKKTLSILTVAALILGILFGIFFPEYLPYVEFAGVWYVKILKVFVTPVVFTGIAVSAYGSAGKRDGLVLKAIFCFVLLFAASFLITSLLAAVLDPAGDFAFEEAVWDGRKTSFGILSVLSNLVPRNLSDIFVSPKLFFIVVIAFLFGKLGSLIKKSEGFFKGLEKAKGYIYKALEYFMYVTPLAVFSLTASAMAARGGAFFGAGLRYVGTTYICSLAVMMLVMILPAFFIAGVKPSEYVRKAYRVWIMTVTTCSSAATLPYTVKTCKEDFGLDERVTDAVVPLGCTVNMCGGAVSFALLGLFCAALYGVPVGFADYLLMLFSSLLINMAAPGIPGGGMVIGAGYLEMMGIPLGFMGFYAGIYKFLDMVYTALNVTGDITADIILSKTVAQEKARKV